MFDPKHREILEDGVDVWNSWRAANPGLHPDLSDLSLVNVDLSKADRDRAEQWKTEQAARKPTPGEQIVLPLMPGAVKGRRTPLERIDFSNTNLSGSDLEYCDLKYANLSSAICRETDLSYANLEGANLSKAELYNSNLRGASLLKSDLTDADLTRALLLDANLSGARIDGVRLRQTVFAGTNLSDIEGLDRCRYGGRVVLDQQTLELSHPALPRSFLRGCGLPERLIEHLPSILAREFHSCFISYSSKDGEYAERLYADLQDKGIRCYLAAEDMPSGADLLETIDKEIGKHDKLLVILSEASIASDWVKDEVVNARAAEQERGMKLIVPVRIDDAVLHSDKGWAKWLKDGRNIGDFTHWADHDAYSKAFLRLFRDLRVESAPT